MAGPYYRSTPPHSHSQHEDLLPLHHLDSAQDEHAHGVNAQHDDSETAPFYSHRNSSYYNHNTSEASLPLYRSRSQSLSMAQATNDSKFEDEDAVPPMPERPAAAAVTSGSTVRAVDYTQTDTADSQRQAQPPLRARPAAPERVNTLQSSTNTSSQNHDNSQSTTWSSNANTLTNSLSTQNHPSSLAHQHPASNNNTHDKKRIDWADEVARVFDPTTGTTKSYNDEKIENINGKGSNISRSATPTDPRVARRWTETDMDDENGFDD